MDAARDSSRVSSRKKKKKVSYRDGSDDEDELGEGSSNAMQLDGLNSSSKKRRANTAMNGPSKSRRKLIADAIAEESESSDSDGGEFYKNTVKKLLESCARDKINAMNCFGQTVIDKVTVDQAKKSNLQDMAGFLEQALHIYSYRVEHAFTEAKSAWDVLTRGRSGKSDIGKLKSASGKEDGDAEGGLEGDLNSRGKKKKNDDGNEKIHILDRFESMRIEPLKKATQEDAEENEEEEEETTENVEKSALKSGNVTEGYIDRLAKAEDIDRFLADDLKIRRGVYEKFRRNKNLENNMKESIVFLGESNSADIVCSTAFQKAISRQRESSAASILLYNGQWSGDGRLIYLHREIDTTQTDTLSVSPESLNPDLVVGMHNILCNVMQPNPTQYGRDLPIDPNKTQTSVVIRGGGVNQELIEATRREMQYDVGDDLPESDVPPEIPTERPSSVMTNYEDQEMKPDVAVLDNVADGMATQSQPKPGIKKQVLISTKDLNEALHVEGKPLFYNTPDIDFDPLNNLLKKKLECLERVEEGEVEEGGEGEEAESGQNQTRKVTWKKNMDAEELNLPEHDDQEEMKHVEESKLAYELHLLDEAYNAEPARLQLRKRLEAVVPGPEGKKKWLEPGKYLVLTQREVYPKNYPADPYSEELMMNLSQSGSSMLEDEPDFGSDRSQEPASGLVDEVEAASIGPVGSDADNFSSPIKSPRTIASVDDLFQSDDVPPPPTYLEASDIELDVEVAPQTNHLSNEGEKRDELEGRYDNVADVPVIEDVDGVIETENEVIELKGKADDAHWKGSAQARKEMEAKKKQRKPRTKKPANKILDLYRPMDPDEKQGLHSMYRFKLASNPNSLMRKPEVLRPIDAKRQSTVMTRNMSKTSPEEIVHARNHANFVHFDDVTRDEILSKLIVGERGRELKAAVSIFTDLDELRPKEKYPSQIVGEAEVDAAIDDEVFYDSQDHFDNDDFGDVPMAADEPGPSTSAAANRTNNSLSALANINPAWQKAAKDMYQKMGRIRLEVTQMDIYGYNDSAEEEGLYLDELQGPIKAPHIDTAVMKREIGAVLANDKYSYNVIKKIYDKCKEQKQHKKETTIAAIEHDSSCVPDYDKDTLEMSRFITEQPEYHEDDEVFEGADAKLGGGMKHGKKKNSMGMKRLSTGGVPELPSPKKMHLTEGEVESPVKGVHTFCSMASALHFRLPENERKCARSNYFVMSLHRCNEKKMKIYQEKPANVADVTRADGSVPGSCSRWMSDFCFVNAEDVRKRDFERTAYLEEDSDAYDDEEDERRRLEDIEEEEEEEESEDRVTDRHSDAAPSFRSKRFNSIFADIPQPERTILLDTQSQDNEQNELNGVGQVLTNGDVTVNGQEQEAKQQVDDEEGREAEEAVQSKPKRIESSCEIQEEEEVSEDNVNGILSDRFFDPM